MFKLVLEKAKEPEIKMPTSIGSSKKQASSRKTSISALLTMPMPLTVWITINCGKFWERWKYPEVSPECSLKGLMLKLKLQYFGHLVGRADSFEKTLLLGKTEGMRRRGRQRMRWLDVNTDSMDCVPGTIHLRSLCLCSSHFKLGIKASWSAGAIRGLQFFLGYKAYNSSCLRSPMGSKHNLCRLLY